MNASTPLWYYILREAELLEGGQRLGPVGATIVGEVILGLLRADDSFTRTEHTGDFRRRFLMWLSTVRSLTSRNSSCEASSS